MTLENYMIITANEIGRLMHLKVCVRIYVYVCPCVCVSVHHMK